MSGILGSFPFTRRRFAAGSRGSDGRFVPGSMTSTTISGSIQPEGRSQSTTELGERSSGNWVVLTQYDLRTVDQEAGTLADRIVWMGIVYEVRETKLWTRILPHTEAKVVQWQEQDGAGQPEPDESILQGVRSYLKAVLSLTDAQVIPANDKGPRPPLPYMTVRMDRTDQPDSLDTRMTVDADVLTITGGAVDDVYAVSVQGSDVEYTRLEDDTDGDVAAALLALLLDLKGITGTVSGPVIVLISLTQQALDTSVVSGDISLEVGGLPAETVEGLRTADVEIVGYGAMTDEWMTQAVASLRLAIGIQACVNAGIVIRADGGINNRASMVDTQIEARWSRSLSVDYAMRGAAQPLTPLSTVLLSGVLHSQTGDDIDLSLDLNVES